MFVIPLISSPAAQAQVWQFTIIRKVPCRKREWPLEQWVIYHYFQPLGFLSVVMAHCQERWFWNFVEKEETFAALRPISRWATGDWRRGGGREHSLSTCSAPVASGALFHRLLSVTSLWGRKSGIYWGLTVDPTLYSQYLSESSQQPMRGNSLHLEVKLQGLNTVPRVKELLRGGSRTWKHLI